MGFLTREQIIGSDAVDDREYDVVECPEWGGEVRLSSITGRARDEYEQSLIEQRGNDRRMNLRNARAKLIVLTAVDENGNNLFTAEDLNALGRKSAKPLDRLFTAAQTRRLWLRDRHCSYPGCDMPGHWCDAHHLIHWADGGPSDLANAALLCEGHHTIVHTRRYAGVLVEDDTGSRVEWELTVGSYDRLLAVEAAREPA